MDGLEEIRTVLNDLAGPQTDGLVEKLDTAKAIADNMADRLDGALEDRDSRLRDQVREVADGLGALSVASRRGGTICRELMAGWGLIDVTGSAVFANTPERSLLRGEGVAVTASADKEGSQEVEAMRTDLSIDCAADAYHGKMDRFPNLTGQQKRELHEQIRSIGDEEALNVFLYGLLVHDSGKNQEVTQEVCRLTGASPDIDHDEVFARLITDPACLEARRRFLPGFDDLPEWGQRLLQEVAGVGLNYPQVLQGEAPGDALEGAHRTTNQQALLWDILKAKFDIFGALGNINREVSLTATRGTWRRMCNLDEVLLDPDIPTAVDRKNAFLDKELEYFIGPVTTTDPDELAHLRALADLECHKRVDTREQFESLRVDFESQPPIVEEILSKELTRSGRATLAYYGPALLNLVTAKEGGAFALKFFAHVLQEAHIADIEARRAGLTGISTIQMDGLIDLIKSGEFNPRQDAVRFLPDEDGVLVATKRKPSLDSLDDLPQFEGGEELRGKKVIFLGVGGGSDCIQAAMVSKLMARRYGCEAAAVVSARNERRKVANTGLKVGEATREVTPNTVPVGAWRFLENIPLEGADPSKVFILNSKDPEVISRDIEALIRETGAEVVVGVDTGGDSYYRSLHAGFSSHVETDITPDHDYVVLEGLSRAATRSSAKFLSVGVSPGIDSPQYVPEVLDEIGAAKLGVTPEEAEFIKDTYREWRMDGSGSEEGRYGKTPLAWLRALDGEIGLQHLDLPTKNVTSDTDPWRAFMTITRAMREIVVADLERHFAAIRRI